MGCEQSNLSSNQKASQIGARGKKMSFYQEESKSKDPPARPMSKMDAKTTFSSSSQASKPKAAPQQQQQTDIEHKESVIKSQEISLYSNLQEELENELSRREHSETEILMKKEDREEPPYQITKEQHKEIFAFAKESCRLVHVYSQRLHEHLLKSIEENNELPSIMEYLKNSSKDVENCVDDLRVYPIQNEKKFYGELEKSRKVAREIKAEYKKYEEKAYDYSSFREIVLDIIYKYNASMEDPKQKGQSKDTNATNTREGTMTALSRPSLASPTSNANEQDHDHEKKEEWVSSGIDNEKNDYDAVASDKKTGVDTPSTQEDGVKSIVDIEALSKEKLGFEVKNEGHAEEKTEEIQDLENKNETPNSENEAEKEGENMEKIENIEDIQLVEKPEAKENGIENEIDSLIVQGETEMRERRDSKGVV